MTKNPLVAVSMLMIAACGKEGTSSGPICVGTDCTADVYVACFTTDEVKGLSRELDPSSVKTFAVEDGPIALDFGGGGLWVSHVFSPSVVRLAPGVAADRTTLAAGGDLQEVRLRNAIVFTTNSDVSTIVAVDPVRRAAIDEVSLSPAPGTKVFPQGFDFVGDRAYVAIYGNAAAPSFEVGQEIAVVDFSNVGACATPPCARIVRRISLQNVPGAYDAGGFPFPSRVLALGSRVFVTISNLAEGPFGGFYTSPAGNGRLAVIDVAAGDAVSIVDLGAGCTNPGSLAADGVTVWVACSNGAVVPVNAGSAPPSVGTAIPVPVVAGQIAMCKGAGYVTDQFSGSVVRFDPNGTVAAPVEVCAFHPDSGFAWAADVECGP